MNLVKIKDVASVFNGYAFKSGDYSSEGFQVIRIANVQDGYISNANQKFIQLHNSTLKRFILNEGEILISLTGNVGRVGKISKQNLPAVLNQRVGKIVFKSNKVLPNYLFNYFRSSKTQNILISKGKGIAQKNIGSSDIENLEIPLPAIEIQQRIIDIFDHIDSLRQKRKQAIDLLDEYLKSTFNEMFGDPINNEKNWEIKKLGEVADIASGVTKGRNFGSKETVLTPYMRVANVQDENIDLHEIKTIEVLPGDVEKYRLIAGDILLTEGGDPDKLGRGGIWRGEIENCIHQNHIFRARLNSQIALPEYISAQIGSRRGKNYFLRSAKQTTGIATINITQLKNYPALIPPINVQSEYGKIFNNVRDLKKIMLAQAIELDNQFQALIQKYFSQK